MKEWFEYQLKNQVVDLNWDYASQPVDNVIHDLHKIFDKIKQLHQQNKLDQIAENFFGQDYVDLLEDIGTEDSKEIFSKSKLKDALDNSDVNQVLLPAVIEKYLCKYFANRFGLRTEMMNMRVHLQQPGQYILFHLDRPKHKFYNLSTDPKADPLYQKYLIFFDDWQAGHCLQMGNNFIKWKRGDVFTWNQRDVPHGSANFGHEPRWVLRVSGLKATAPNPYMDLFYSSVVVVTDNPDQKKQIQALDPDIVVIDKISQAQAKYMVLLNDQVHVRDLGFFTQINWLFKQNPYLDVLKHPAWILFNCENVKPHDDRDYWHMNLRPAHDFDDSTWSFQHD